MIPQIQTYMNRLVRLDKPSPDDIDIIDIATALSNLTRFTGHVGFYSVAEHSYGVAVLTRYFAVRDIEACTKDSRLLFEAFKAGLLHDASEAYLGDVSSPLKMLLPEYRKLEAQFEEVINEKFKVHAFKVSTPAGTVDLVKAADLAMLELERQTFFGAVHRDVWPGFVPGYEVSNDLLTVLTFGAIDLGVPPRLPIDACNLFLHGFYDRP